MTERTWCQEHQRYERADDYIDFQVSPAWRDYYYEAGLTPYPSPQYQARKDKSLKIILVELLEAIENLRPPTAEAPQRWIPAQPYIPPPSKQPQGPIAL